MTLPNYITHVMSPKIGFVIIISTPIVLMGKQLPRVKPLISEARAQVAMALFQSPRF